MIIDAHQHFWQLDMPLDHAWLHEPQHAPICRNYLPEDLWPQMQQAGVDRSVFVQTQHDLNENRWALALADQHSFLAGVVGWVDLAADSCEDQLLEFREHPLFVGVRHITQGEPDEDFIVRSDVVRGLQVLQKHGVPFDLLFYVQHLRHAATLATLLPDLPMVIDHLAKPQIRSGAIVDWARDIQAAAACPNIYCKLSGMITEADWKNWNSADLQPYVHTVLEAFGPGRCMFGSDWPVCELAGSYRDVIQALSDTLGSISPSERAQIFGGTAERFYHLNSAATR